MNQKRYFEQDSPTLKCSNQIIGFVFKIKFGAVNFIPVKAFVTKLNWVYK